MTTRTIKILSDFDGVWTDQGREAEALLRNATARLADARGVPLERAAADVERFVAHMRAAPAEHGWAPGGRLSAYVDEDPLVETSSLCRLLATWDDPDAVAYREAMLAAGFSTLDDFAQDVFEETTAIFRRDHPPCLVEGAAELLAAIHAAGAEVVVVSNSSADKIGDWFGRAGIDARETGDPTVRLRGSAAKWLVGESDDSLLVGGRRVATDRPRYRAALEAEAPDLIIGDVFSLDLALPHALRLGGRPGAPRRLVLRRHPHTPRWVLDDLAGGAIDRVVDGVAELPDIVRSLREQI